VSTAGDQIYGDSVVLNAISNLTTLTGTNITFGTTLRSANDAKDGLIVSGTGLTTFTGPVGDNTQRLASLTTNNGGTTAINGGSVTTSGSQVYNDQVTLGADTTLTGAAIAFLSTLDSDSTARPLTVNAAGTTTFA